MAYESGLDLNRFCHVNIGFKKIKSKGFLIFYNMHSIPYYAKSVLVIWVWFKINSLLIRNETMFSDPVINYV